MISNIANGDDSALGDVLGGKLHVLGDSLLEALQRLGLAAMLELDFSTVKQQLGIGGHDVRCIVTIEPTSIAILGRCCCLAATPEHGSGAHRA